MQNDKNSSPSRVLDWIEKAAILWIFAFTAGNVATHLDVKELSLASWVVSGWAGVLIAWVTALVVSIVYHRSGTHQSIVLHPIIQKTGELYLKIITGIEWREWTQAHRYHHGHADTNKDPHSPRNSGLKKMLLDFTYRDYTRRIEELKNDWAFKEPQKMHSLGEKVLYPSLVLNAWVAWFWSSHALIAFISTYIWLKLVAWTVNGVWHNHEERRQEYGKSYAQNIGENSSGIKKRLIQVWINFTGWEGLHGNHHLHPNSADLSLGWKDGTFDLGFFCARILEKIWLAKIKVVYNSQGKRTENK